MYYNYIYKPVYFKEEHALSLMMKCFKNYTAVIVFDFLLPHEFYFM